MSTDSQTISSSVSMELSNNTKDKDSAASLVDNADNDIDYAGTDNSDNHSLDPAYPIRFEPSKLFKRASILHENAVLDAKSNVKVRVIRALIICILAPSCLIVLTLIPSHPLSFVVGIGLLTMYVLYFGTIFRLFFTGKRKGKGIYRVYSTSNIPPDWAKVSVASCQLLYPNKAIQSISEFSAIDGAVPNTMLATLSAYTWAFVIMHLAAHIWGSCDFKWDIADIFELIGVAGLIFIGIFELDPYNRTMQIFHYSGAAMGTGTIIGYIIQQYSLGTKLWLALLIGAAALIAFCMWQWFGYQTNKFQKKHHCIKESDVHKIRDEITRWSLKNVTAEAIFLFLGAASMCLWIMDYDQNCSVGCRGPVNTECNNA